MLLRHHALTNLVSVGCSVVACKGKHRLSARWQLINSGQGHVPMGGESKGAGDGRRCHCQHMGQWTVLVLQLYPLVHAKPEQQQ